MVVHVVQEIPILAKPAAMADAVRATGVDGLMDRRGPIGLASVDGHVDIVPAHQPEGGQMRLRRILRLGPR